MKKLTKLTKKQLKSLPLKVKKWIDEATTGTTDEKKAREAVLRVYEKGGLKPPTVVIFLDSPIKCLVGRFYAAAYLNAFTNSGAQVRAQVYAQVYDQVDDQVGDQVRDQVDAQVHDQVHAQVDDQVGARVDAQVHDQVHAQVDAQVGARVDAQVHAQVRDQVDAQVHAQVRDQVHDQVDAQVDDQVDAQVRDQVGDQVRGTNLWQWYTFSIWWCAWLAYQETLCEFANLDFQTEGIRDLFKAKASWTWCYPEIAIICRMPQIKRDGKGRLHSLTQKAVKYPDEYGFYYINGVAFEEKQWLAFTQNKMDAIDIMNEKNQDRKRVMIMNYGNEKLIKELKAKLINEEKDSQENMMRLWSVPRKKDEPMIFYEGVDPSKNEKIYLRVPPEFKDRTAYEAKLWSFKPLWELYQNKEKFSLLQET